MKVPITDAFQPIRKMAPAPKRKENIIARTKTKELFEKMKKVHFSIDFVAGVLHSFSPPALPVIFEKTFSCSEKIFSLVGKPQFNAFSAPMQLVSAEGRTTYHNV